MSRAHKWIAAGIFLYLALVWGSSFILIDRGILAFSPYQLGALRMVIAGLVMLPFIIRHPQRLQGREWIWVILVGLIGNGIPAILFPLAETQIPSSAAGILNTLSPLFVLFFGIFFFQLRPNNRQKIGIFLGFVGACVLIYFRPQEVGKESDLRYALLVVLATICYGLATNIMKKFLNHTSSVLATGYALVIIAIPYLIYLLFSGVEKPFIESHPDLWISVGSVIVLAALGTSLALVLFYRLVQITDPVISSSVTYLIPIVAVLWGIYFNEALHPLQFVGMGGILLGVWLVNRNGSKKGQ